MVKGAKQWLVKRSYSSIFLDYEYRIKSKPTLLPVSHELWWRIDKKRQFIAMDESKGIYFYDSKPSKAIAIGYPLLVLWVAHSI